MLAEIRTLGAALGLSEGGLLKVARDVSQDGALLSLGHMRRIHQVQMLDFLRQVAEYEHAELEDERIFA